MADDIAKVTSMRLNEDDLEQFKAFAKDNGLNQQQAFNSLIALAELEKAKDVLGTRATSIDSFRSTVTTLINFYVNALEENTTTEQTIRGELQKELNTKDNTISTIYEQLQELKADKINLEGNLKDIESKNKELQDQLTKANNEIIEKNKSIDIANRNNNTLQEQLEEYKQYKTQYKALEKELEQLKKDSATSDDTINNLTNDNKQLSDKLNNANDMNKFYKDNITDLKKDIAEHKSERKSLEDKHTKEIVNIKIEYTQALEMQLQALQEQYNDKMDVELDKKDLEIERLKAKTVKPVNTVNNNIKK